MISYLRLLITPPIWTGLPTPHDRISISYASLVRIERLNQQAQSASNLELGKHGFSRSKEAGLQQTVPSGRTTLSWIVAVKELDVGT